MSIIAKILKIYFKCKYIKVIGWFLVTCPSVMVHTDSKYHIDHSIFSIIICQMFIVQAHWSILCHITICNQAYFLSKTILTRQYYNILFSIMVLLLWRHIVLLWCHIVLLFIVLYTVWMIRYDMYRWYFQLIFSMYHDIFRTI